MAVTFNAYAPFDSGPGANVTESGWQAMQRRTGNPGVIRDSLDGLSAFGDSTGMQVKVNTGEVWAEGAWGLVSSLATLPITSNGSGQPRRDLVVWRLDSTNNRFELDVKAGTAAADAVIPPLTRTSTIYEGPIAYVDVANGAVTIAAADVKDIRWSGGPTVPTLADDYTFFGDKISSAQRSAVTNATAGAASQALILALAVAQRDVTATQIRYYLETARSGGSASLMRVYIGYSRDRLTDATGAITVDETAGADTVKIVALPSTLVIPAGTYIGFGFLTNPANTGGGTNPILGHTALVGAGNGAELLNPSVHALDPRGRWSSVQKTGQSAMPSVIQVHVEGTWTKRAAIPWFALA